MMRLLSLLSLLLLLCGCIQADDMAKEDTVALEATAFSARGMLAGEAVEISLAGPVPCEASPKVPASCLPAKLGHEEYLLPTGTMEPLLIDGQSVRVVYGPTVLERVLVFAPLRLVGTEYGIGDSAPFEYLGMRGSALFMSNSAVELSFRTVLEGSSNGGTLDWVYEIELEPRKAIPRSISSYLRNGTDRVSEPQRIWAADSLTVASTIPIPAPAKPTIPLEPVTSTKPWKHGPPSDTAAQAMRFPLAKAVEKAKEQSTDVRSFFEQFPESFLVDATYQSQFTTVLGRTSLLWTMQWEGQGQGLRFSVQFDMPALPEHALQYQTEVISQQGNQISDLKAQRRDSMVPIEWAYSECVTNEQGPFVFGYRDLDTDDSPPSRVSVGGVPFRLAAWYVCQFEGEGHQRDAYLGIVTAWTP